MRTALALAALLTALIWPSGPALAARFDIRLEEHGPDRMLIVSRAKTGAVAAAAGREKLRLLPKEEALAAYQRLKEGVHLLAPAADPATAPDRRIIIHRLDVEEDLENGASDRERSVVRKHVKAPSPDAYDSQADAEPMPVQSDENARPMIKRTEFEGADEKTAAAFIDAVAGLAPADKARLKALVGIAPADKPARKGFAVIRASAEKPGLKD